MKLKPKRVFQIIIVLILLSPIAIGAFVYAVVDGELASLEQLENPKSDLATTVLSADGEILDQFFVERRTYIPFDSIPADFINALIATEDRSFYDHWGIDIYGIMRAMWSNIISFELRQGASTITQQLARNLYLNHAPTINRKIREAITAVQIEKHYTKREILELYANTVYFGRGAYGLAVAAQIFFNKSPMELSTSECAYLVGVLKNPYRYTLASNPTPGIYRRNTVLTCMHEVGIISDAEFSTARNRPIEFAEAEETIGGRSIAPHFVEMVRKALREHPDLREKNLDLYRDGLVVYTTLNAQMQRYANESVQENLVEVQERFDRRWNWARRSSLENSVVRNAVRNSKEYHEATDNLKAQVQQRLLQDKKFVAEALKEATRVQVGFTVLDYKNGAIRALVGGSRFGKSERYTLNHATQIARQPGSAFKPFLYTTILEGKYLSPDSMINAGPFAYSEAGMVKPWTLEPHSKHTSGSVSLRNALRLSINTVAARLVTEYTTPDSVAAMARKMGIKSPLGARYVLRDTVNGRANEKVGFRHVPSMALGTDLVNPLEMTAAYSVFPNHGVYVEPFIITRIEDRYGNTIYDRGGSIQAADAISEQVAGEMVQMMQTVVESGTGVRARSSLYTAAGKTGTTNDYADAWFIGYTPHLSAGVWVGFDDVRIKFPTDDGQGGRTAAPIWGKFMEKVYKDPLLGYSSKDQFNIRRAQEGDELPEEYRERMARAEEESDNPGLKEARLLEGLLPAKPATADSVKKASGYKKRDLRSLRDLRQDASRPVKN